MTGADSWPLLSRRVDSALTGGESRRLDTHLAGCPDCRATLRMITSERRLLRDHWPAVAAPAGFTASVLQALPSGSRPRPASPLLRRLPALATAALVLLLAACAVATPVLVLRAVLLRETNDPPVERLIDPGAELDLEAARARVPWRIRTPRALPDGCRLVAVTVGDVHEAADGPTVVLHYRQGDAVDGPALRITQLRATGRIEEPVEPEPGAVTRTRVGDRVALLIDGAWQEHDGRPVWVRGALLRLILEDDGLVTQIEAEPRDGWDAAGLKRVAASLR